MKKIIYLSTALSSLLLSACVGGSSGSTNGGSGGGGDKKQDTCASLLQGYNLDNVTSIRYAQIAQKNVNMIVHEFGVSVGSIYNLNKNCVQQPVDKSFDSVIFKFGNLIAAQELNETLTPEIPGGTPSGGLRPMVTETADLPKLEFDKYTGYYLRVNNDTIINAPVDSSKAKLRLNSITCNLSGLCSVVVNNADGKSVTNFSSSMIAIDQKTYPDVQVTLTKDTGKKNEKGEAITEARNYAVTNGQFQILPIDKDIVKADANVSFENYHISKVTQGNVATIVEYAFVNNTTTMKVQQ